MADPIVGIVNGVPTSGTGNITTLGQTLLDGANITYGATTDLVIAAGAAGSISAKLRAISRDVAGGIVLQPGANVIGAVTQSGGPWSVSGTLAVTQSGAWNITNITGTISLPTGAATSALQPTNAAIGSTTAGQTGTMALGATTTAAPTYTTLQTNPLSLTTAGGLRVDGSGTTQPVSGTVTVNGTIGATQSGVWTVQPGNTANTTPWLMTINQGGNAATVSAAGALKVDASATTQPVSAASLPLPAGASTAANQPSVAAQGSTTSGQTGTLSEGAVGTSAPVYTNGTTQPISLTTAGAIRVDSSAVTQPVSGTLTVTQATAANLKGQVDPLTISNWGLASSVQNIATPTNGMLIQGQFNTTPTTITTGNVSPLQLDASGNLLVNVKAGGGAGGTSSSFGSAFPATGTAVGAKDSAGTNMQPLNLDASGNLKVNVAAGGASGGTSSSFGAAIPATGTASGFSDGTNMQLARVFDGDSGAGTQYSLGVLLKTPASGGAVDFGVSGQPIRIDPTGTTTQPVSGTVGISGTVTVTGTIAATQSGAWNITNVSGTISLPTGAATSANQPTNAALGSTTTGQTGNLQLGAVTTAAPSYTTGQTNALSLTPAGALRVDNSAVTQPVSGTFWQATQPVSGTITASQGGTWTVQPGNTTNTTPWLTTARVVGNAGAILDFAGQNVAAPANAILMGAEFNTTPTTITSGNASPLQLDNAGNLLVNVKAGGGAGGTSSSFSATFPATGTAAGAEYLSSAPTLTTGQMVALQTDINGNLKVNIQAGAGSGGTSSNFGAAFPAAGTAAGGEYLSSPPTLTSGQMVALQTNVNGALKIDGSAVTQPVSGTFWQTTQPVSGTVTANQGGAPWTMKPDGTAWAMTSTSANVNVTNASIAVTGTFWQATQPVSGTVTVTQATAANLNATVTGTVAATQSGAWNVTNITGTITLPTGAATSANQPTNAAAASTTAGQTGTLGFAAVVAGTSAYTTATSQPLNMDTAGNLKVNTIDPATYNAGTAWNSGTGLNTTAALLNTTAIAYDTIIGQITQTTTITGGAITFEESFDNGATYATIPSQRFVDPTTYLPLANPYPCVASTNQRFHIIPASTGQVRARLSTVITGTGAVTVSWTLSPITSVELNNSICAGDTPSGATDGGWPIKTGGLAKTTNPTAVADGQRVASLYDKLGKQIAVGAIRALKGVQKTSITVNTETTVVTAGGAGVFNDVYAIVVTNKSATSVFVDFKDATAGTTRMTLAAPANDTRGFTVAVDSAMVQAVAASNWTATVSAAVTSIEITMLYVQNL